MEKVEKRSRSLILGWISFGINAIIFLGSPTSAIPKDYIIKELFQNLSVTALLGTIFYCIGVNIFTVLAFLVGFLAWKRNGDEKGRTLAHVSIILFILSSIKEIFFGT